MEHGTAVVLLCCGVSIMIANLWLVFQVQKAIDDFLFSFNTWVHKYNKLIDDIAVEIKC